MAKVRILDDKVVNQIAAGEVVERPASVVKELVENSIDAGAMEITVVITNGGKSSIQVIDDGGGMSREDALLAVERFGTSKISDVEDLHSIETHGFRGEALPSIASVSKLHLTSREREGSSDKGVDLVIHGGRIRDVENLDVPLGTRVEVRQLFYNVPARKKFLRAEGTETGVIRATLLDFAVAYPDRRFRLVSDGKEIFHYTPVKSFRERVNQLKSGGKGAVQVDEELGIDSGRMRVRASLSQPVEAVSSAGRLRLLVNGRSVRDKLLLRAVREGYGNFLKPGKFPAGVVQLEVPAEEVDVNVHPQKSEVRFRSPDIIFRAVSDSVRHALSEFEHVPEYSMPMPSLGTSSVAEPSPSAFSFESMRRKDGAEVVFSGDSPFEEHQASAERGVSQLESVPPEERPSQMRYVGQLFRCYLVLEGRELVAIVDMHAAHERVKFYQIKKQFLEGTIAKQELLIPETIALPAEKVAQFESSQKALSELGIECELFGDDAIVVRSIPAILSSSSAKAIVEDLLSLPDWSDWSADIARRADDVIARLACHGSIRSGREMKREEVYPLLEALEDAEASSFCPHGRPIVKYMRERDFESMFGRI